jgi:gamma-glutamyltranspeptidase
MTLQLLVDRIDFGLQPENSVMAPRFMSDHFISSFGQKPPVLGQLRINPELGSETLEALKRLGHKLVVRTGSLAAAPCAMTGMNRGEFGIDPAGDSRTGRHARTIR